MKNEKLTKWAFNERTLQSLKAHSQTELTKKRTILQNEIIGKPLIRIYDPIHQTIKYRIKGTARTITETSFHDYVQKGIITLIDETNLTTSNKTPQKLSPKPVIQLRSTPENAPTQSACPQTTILTNNIPSTQPEPTQPVPQEQENYYENTSITTESSSINSFDAQDRQTILEDKMTNFFPDKNTNSNFFAPPKQFTLPSEEEPKNLLTIVKDKIHQLTSPKRINQTQEQS